VLAPHLAEFRAKWERYRPGEGDPVVAVVQPVQSAATRADDFPEQMTDRLVALRRMGVAKVLLNLSWRRPERVPGVLAAIRSAADRALQADVAETTQTGG
jgi:hypothetical protein